MVQAFLPRILPAAWRHKPVVQWSVPQEGSQGDVTWLVQPCSGDPHCVAPLVAPRLQSSLEPILQRCRTTAGLLSLSAATYILQSAAHDLVTWLQEPQRDLVKWLREQQH